MPPCDISLTSHNNGRVICHYCAYEEGMPKLSFLWVEIHCCFGTGRKVEELVKGIPHARTLRMDTDTTKQRVDMKPS